MTDFLDAVTQLFGKEVAARSVFGEPVQANGRVVVPVARVAFGFSGGVSARPGEGEARARGSGGGGGATVRPLGVFDIAPEGVTYRPVVQPAAVAGAIAAGIVLGLVLGRALGRRPGR